MWQEIVVGVIVLGAALVVLRSLRRAAGGQGGGETGGCGCCGDCPFAGGCREHSAPGECPEADASEDAKT